MASSANANAKEGKWTPDDDLKLIFTCLLHSQGKDLKINGWTDIEALYNEMPGSHFTRSAILQRYNKLKKEFTINYLDKIPASSGNGEGSSAAKPTAKTGGKRKASAAVGSAGQDKEKNTKKARKSRAEKATNAKDGSDAEDADDYKSD